MRLVVVAAGFHRVKVLGRHHLPSNSRDAPVVVMAPHSSFFDAMAIVCLGAPSVVAKADTARLPFIGRRSSHRVATKFHLIKLKTIQQY
ncbi:unnamed protein product [Arctia plantaginis]|uniref:Phospholipid/glycerol acyltransferase domain-containing protein n=1 Tax=Arctia plantaginis TaxID=874455 RepID=A0A8S0YMK4_ARCPL|nr:unnamed protein product [Arctia plantaginis]